MDAIQEDVSEPLNLNSAAAKILEMDVEPEQVEPSEETESEEIEATEETTEELEASEEAEETTSEEEVTEPDATDDEVSAFVSELNDYFSGADRDALSAIKVPVKINGDESQATLADVVRDYQLRGNLDQKTDELSAKVKAFESEREQRLDEYTQRLQQASGLVDGLEKQFTAHFDQVNWQELRDTDPAEFAAKQNDLQRVKQVVDGYRSTISESSKQAQRDNYEKTVLAETERLYQRIPEWKDATVADAGKKELRDYLVSQDFTVKDIEGELDSQGNIKSMGMIDARIIDMARKAMMFDKGQKKVAVTKKKVRKLPKVARPGKPVTNAEITSERSKKMRGRLKKSGRMEDAAALLFQGD